MAAAFDQRNRLVVGIDFGTTFSGVAYLYVKPEENPDYTKIKLIQTWPGAGSGGGIDNRNLEKVPTLINFGNGDPQWGFGIPPGSSPCALFKLLLEKRASKKTYNDPTQPEDVDEGELPNWKFDRTPEDVTREFLKLLYAHVVQCLRTDFPSTFNITPIHFVITVPSIWSHVAQQKTREMAGEAGFGKRHGDKITMVSEPEAAGAYCLREMHTSTENGLKVGESILICDAGGGTVDFVTYTVSEITPCLRVREVVEVTGGRFGSTAIDRAFLRWLRPLSRPVSKKVSLDSRPTSVLMRHFESAKRGYGISEETEKWLIPLGKAKNNKSAGIQDGELTLQSKIMSKFFTPIVQRVIDHAADRIGLANAKNNENKVAKILLVGGFGESTYLFDRLSDWCKSQDYPIQIFRPQHPWTAVARGAVIHGIESLVDSRKLREHYGVMLSTEYDPALYDSDTAYFNPLLGMVMTSDNVAWFAAKGQEAGNNEHFVVGGQALFADWSDRKFTLKLVASERDVVLESYRRSGAHVVGLVHIDLSDAPHSAFRISLQGRQRQRQITVITADVSVEMSIASADLKFEAMFEGESYGTTRIEYHHVGDLPNVARLQLDEDDEEVEEVEETESGELYDRNW